MSTRIEDNFQRIQFWFFHFSKILISFREIRQKLENKQYSPVLTIPLVVSVITFTLSENSFILYSVQRFRNTLHIGSLGPN